MTRQLLLGRGNFRAPAAGTNTNALYSPYNAMQLGISTLTRKTMTDLVQLPAAQDVNRDDITAAKFFNRVVRGQPTNFSTRLIPTCDAPQRVLLPLLSAVHV